MLCDGLDPYGGCIAVSIAQIVMPSARAAEISGAPGRTFPEQLKTLSAGHCRRSTRASEQPGQSAREKQADADGRFAFKGMAPGVYAVLGEKTNFKTATAIVTVTRARRQANRGGAGIGGGAQSDRGREASRSGAQQRCHPIPAEASIALTKRQFRNCRRATIPNSIKYCCRRPAWCRIHSASFTCAAIMRIFSIVLMVSSCRRESLASARY